MPKYNVKMIFETTLDFDDCPDKTAEQNLESVYEYVYDEYINMVNNSDRDFQINKQDTK